MQLYMSLSQLHVFKSLKSPSEFISVQCQHGPYLEITIMKYDQYCPRIFRVNAVNARTTVAHIFFSEVQQEGIFYQKLTP